MPCAVTADQLFHLDPRTKITLMAIVSTTEFLSSHTSMMIATALVPCLLMISDRQYRKATFFSAIFACAVVVKELHGTWSVNLLLNMCVVFLVGFVLKLLPAFAMGSYIIHSTNASEMLSAMEQVRLSRKITIPLSVMFRFVPTMKEERRSIADAMSMRGLHLGSKKFWKNPMALLEYRLVPLMISVVKIGDDLTAAALSRGIDNPVRRTNIIPVAFSDNDVVALLLTALLFISASIITATAL